MYVDPFMSVGASAFHGLIPLIVKSVDVIGGCSCLQHSKATLPPTDKIAESSTVAKPNV